MPPVGRMTNTAQSMAALKGWQRPNRFRERLIPAIGHQGADMRYRLTRLATVCGFSIAALMFGAILWAGSVTRLQTIVDEYWLRYGQSPLMAPQNLETLRWPITLAPLVALWLVRGVGSWNRRKTSAA